MSELDWSPQEAFKDFFYTDSEQIVKNGTVFREDVDYSVPYGGRGSGKTYQMIKACVTEATLRPVRVLATREIQNSIQESVKAEIEACITDMGLDWFFTVTRDEIRSMNGSKFIFKGIKNNIKNLKSISDVDIVLCEEAENITKDSWDKLLPSIRPRKPFGNRGKRPITIVIFNPDDELDDTYQRFIVNQPPRSVVKLINWRDNKYFPDHLNDMRLHSLKTRPLKDHEHDWEGKPKSQGDDVIISRDWVRAARFASKKEGFNQQGDKVIGYDPSGQGKDANAVVYADGNIIKEIDEWLKSDDLRKASKRAFSHAIKHTVDKFVFDTCGGLGDGVEVFVGDALQDAKNEIINFNVDIHPFDAGAGVVNPDNEIEGTTKTWKDMYSNAKAQNQAITAQKLYNTYRFIELGETDIKSSDMISIDIEDDYIFNKLVKELSCPVWVKSATNSKKKVESKKDMEKRTGQMSPNISDAFHMTQAPQETKQSYGLVFKRKK